MCRTIDKKYLRNCFVYIVAVGISCCSMVEAVRAVAAERPNILFIMSDDHGYQAISAYESELNQTPNIDRIADEGMRFDRCYVTNSLCGPSRACILTGKYSHKNGFYDNTRSKFDGSQVTFPKLLRSAGYQTAIDRQVAPGERPDRLRLLGYLAGPGAILSARFHFRQRPAFGARLRDRRHHGSGARLARSTSAIRSGRSC